MRKFLAALLVASSLSSPQAHADTLPLKRVVITTSGLALYEHQGQVSGNAAITLPVHLDQVDDVLKSLVVLDDKGHLGGVTLPGKQPLDELFRDLPFTQDDLGNYAQLLNAMRGAEVQVTIPGTSFAGRLLTVTEETDTTKDGTTITRHRLAVATDSGLHTALLEEASAIKFTDAEVQTELDHALATLFANRVKDQRTVTVNLAGDGKRDVGLAYIEAAPLWKSAYRLVLPADNAKSANAALQGWAILENTTGQDWKGVTVTLMSGAPVAYHQALYESYYTPRSELPLKVMGKILPRTDEGSVDALADKKEAENDATPAMASATAPRQMFAARMMAGNAVMAAPAIQTAETTAPEPSIATATSAPAAETAGQLLFAFPQPVDLPAGNSLMVPFLSRTITAEKLWVYQPPESPVFHPMIPGNIVLPHQNTDDTHPFAAIDIKNDSAAGLPPGILTLYGQASGGLVYAGDADMPLIPKGEDRFVSFALDTKTTIDRATQNDHHLGTITIAHGVLSQKAIESNTTTYTIKAPNDEPRTVVIEHPRRPDWQLETPAGLAAPPTMTSDAYRLRVTVPAGQQRVLKVTLNHETAETTALLDTSADDLNTRMAALGETLPANVRAALTKVKALQTDVATQQQALNDIAAQRQSITDDQSRLRDNLKTVSNDSALGKRYLKTLDDQETKLDALSKQEADARTKLTAAQKALQDYVGSLNL